jgi:hypothetical protein
MPRLERPDGAELHWEAQGEGPTVVITPHAWALPELFESLIAELDGDCRIVRSCCRTRGATRSRTGSSPGRS